MPKITIADISNPFDDDSHTYSISMVFVGVDGEKKEAFLFCEEIESSQPINSIALLTKLYKDILPVWVEQITSIVKQGYFVVHKHSEELQTFIDDDGEEYEDYEILSYEFKFKDWYIDD